MHKAEITHRNQKQQNGPLKGVCCAQPGETIKGTFFFPGAGMDGDYIRPLISAFHSAGISSAVYVDRDKWSGGTILDASIGSVLGREYDPRFPMLIRKTSSRSSQFNLIGYSYGSIVASQLAAKYASRGTRVDYLVLIGSPISSNFLSVLRNSINIKNTIIINLDEHGDPIFAGIDTIKLFSSLPTLINQMPKSSGHFYYADPSAQGEERRRALAENLYKIGLR